MSWLQQEYDAMLAYVRASRVPDSSAPILIAGEPERQARAQRLADGIVISEGEWRKITDAGCSLGMSAAFFAA
jgi:uncharacterized oxidoreductase